MTYTVSNTQVTKVELDISGSSPTVLGDMVRIDSNSTDAEVSTTIQNTSQFDGVLPGTVLTHGSNAYMISLGWAKKWSVRAGPGLLSSYNSPTMMPIGVISSGINSVRGANNNETWLVQSSSTYGTILTRVECIS